MRLISIAVVVAALAGSAHADGLRDSVMKKYRAVDQALMRKDGDAFDKLTAEACAPGFKETMMGQSRDHEAMAAEMKKELQGVSKVTSVTTKVNRVVMKKNKAMFYLHRTMVERAKGPDKKTHRYSGAGDCLDTWVKTSKGWKLQSIVWSNMKQTQDGKPMKMGK
ncbi:MAG TPA: hypothetical protein VG944_01515 [Fimbriimonas sp.]|nr:hypothetical protein [Fimbriimonas sp.]